MPSDICFQSPANTILQALANRRQTTQTSQTTNTVRILEETESLPESNDFIDAVIRLGELIYMHARNEELILATTSMPESEVKMHKAAHTQIIEQFANLSFKLLEGERLTRVKILRLIGRRIIEHHIEYDLKIRAYIHPSA